MSKVHDKASEVSAEQGEVQMDGPGGIVLSLTPEAAVDTSDRLLSNASQAKGQQIEQRRLRDETPSRH